MTLDQLKAVMRFQLQNFNDEGVAISDQTVHNEVLDEDDGFGHVNSEKMYQDVMKFTLIKQGHALKKWPSTWTEMTVEELAPQLL